MKILIPLILCCLFATTSVAQKIWDGFPQDSIVVQFASTDTLINDTTKFYIGRTTKDSLWQMGTTQKTFFSTGSFANNAMMTDTTNHYPINANSSFVLNLDNINYNNYNLIISFKHKYQTDSAKDGGLIEFSNDSGKTWKNIVSDCSVPTTASGIQLLNFYGIDDTLQGGTPAFSGTSNGWQLSRFQFFQGVPVKTTATTGVDCLQFPKLIRFRFVSDTTADTLDGWIIDELKLEYDLYWGSVGNIKNSGSLAIYPNPASDVVSFPALYKAETYRIELYNILGARVLDQTYTNKLDVSDYQSGLYYYRVSNGDYLYTGKLLLE